MVASITRADFDLVAVNEGVVGYADGHLSMWAHADDSPYFCVIGVDVATPEGAAVGPALLSSFDPSLCLHRFSFPVMPSEVQVLVQRIAPYVPVDFYTSSVAQATPLGCHLLLPPPPAHLLQLRLPPQLPQHPPHSHMQNGPLPPPPQQQHHHQLQ